MNESVRITLKNEKETRKVAAKIAENCRTGDLLILDGDLGAGKTHFTQWFVERLQSRDVVVSPTFSIANFYRTQAGELLHIDLYRIETLREFEDLGLDEYFHRSITLIEWGKKFSDSFEAYLLIALHVNEDGSRRMTLSCKGEKYKSLTGLLEKELKEITCSH
jgi:tRNA threonylcarbamoyladenosine biosynthesis protein TsaE